MGDGRIPVQRPTGLAHGFRPLEGDHPPPTPTQRDVTSDVGGELLSANQYGCLDSSRRSAMSRNDPSVARDGGVDEGIPPPSKKRRRLPGPLAFLQQEGAAGPAGGAGREEGRAGRVIINQPMIDSDQEENEIGGGHFNNGPWLALCSATDTPVPEEGASDDEAVQAFLGAAVSPMSEVLAGDFDLRVPIVMAVIDSYSKLSRSDVVVELVDPSGRMRGYLHPGCVEEHGPALGAGAAVLLKDVAIFVSGPGTARLLNVHPQCISAVFPLNTPPPPLERLDWLRTCDPPFTPQTTAAHRSRVLSGSPDRIRSPLTTLRTPTAVPRNRRENSQLDDERIREPREARPQPSLSRQQQQQQHSQPCRRPEPPELRKRQPQMEPGDDSHGKSSEGPLLSTERDDANASRDRMMGIRSPRENKYPEGQGRQRCSEGDSSDGGMFDIHVPIPGSLEQGHADSAPVQHPLLSAGGTQRFGCDNVGSSSPTIEDNIATVEDLPAQASTPDDRTREHDDAEDLDAEGLQDATLEDAPVENSEETISSPPLTVDDDSLDSSLTPLALAQESAEQRTRVEDDSLQHLEQRTVPAANRENESLTSLGTSDDGTRRTVTETAVRRTAIATASHGMGKVNSDQDQALACQDGRSVGAEVTVPEEKQEGAGGNQHHGVGQIVDPGSVWANLEGLDSDDSDDDEAASVCLPRDGTSPTAPDGSDGSDLPSRISDDVGNHDTERDGTSTNSGSTRAIDRDNGTPVVEAARSTVGSGAFSLMGAVGGGFGHDDLLDAALDDSD